MSEKVGETRGGGVPHSFISVFTKHLDFLVKTKNVPEGQKCKINDNFFPNKGFPKGGDGGGGSATWEKFPNNTVIFFE